MRSTARWLAALWLSAGWVTASSGEELVLAPRGIEGSELVVDLVARDLDGVGSFSLTVEFDSSKLGPPRFETGPLGAGGMIADNLVREGSYRIAVISAAGISGDGDLVTLRFPVRGSAGFAHLGLEARITDVNGGAISSRVEGASVLLGAADEAEGTDSLLASLEDAALRLETADEGADPDRLRSARRETGPEAVDELSVDGEEGLPSELRDPAREQEEERRRADRAARLAGYAMRVRFDPEERVVDESGPTPILARLTLLKHSQEIEVEAPDVALAASGAEIHRVRVAEGDRGLELELLVDREALPAWLEISAFGLREEHLVPVYPRVDVDFDSSGGLTRSDFAIFARGFGARKGEARYQERFDILPDGEIDKHDVAAFRFNLVRTERARRLGRAPSQKPSEEATP